MSSPRLPSRLYGMAVIARNALASLCIDADSIRRGFTRSGFLFTSMRSIAALPFASRRAEFLVSTSAKTRYRYIRGLSRVPGFCYLKLFRPEWVIPALCTLGPYPASSDVATLGFFFSANPHAIYVSGQRSGKHVLHVVSCPRKPCHKEDTLRSFPSCIVGSQPRPRYFSNQDMPRPPPPVGPLGREEGPLGIALTLPLPLVLSAPLSLLVHPLLKLSGLANVQLCGHLHSVTHPPHFDHMTLILVTSGVVLPELLHDGVTLPETLLTS